MKKRIKRFYLMPRVWRTVTNSQVFNWVKIINENGISSDCISLTKTKINGDSISEIENTIKGKFYQHGIFSPLINDLYLFFVLLGYYLRNKASYDIIIFQTRLANIGIPFFLINLFPKSRIIFESRGATIEERKYENEDLKFSFKEKLKSDLFYFSEKLLINKSDKVICVSRALKNYYLKKFKIKNEDKFFIMPGAADNYLFFYDPKKRERFRKKLGYELDDIVIVYSGALNMKWEIPYEVFKFLSNLRDENSLYKFLIVTPDLVTAKLYVEKFNLMKKTIIVQSSFEEVNDYLNAADIGLLLREDILMNNVASPTKFSEYLLAGLPTIVSKGVYDFAEIIEKTKFGLVLKNINQVSKEDLQKIKDLISIDRNIISRWGNENLSKEKLISEYIELLEHI